jgi:energy-coupling factor transporter transmembrane protein EcfT
MAKQPTPPRQPLHLQRRHAALLALIALAFAVAMAVLHYWWLLGAFGCFTALHLFGALKPPREQSTVQRRAVGVLSVVAVVLAIIGALVHILPAAF